MPCNRLFTKGIQRRKRAFSASHFVHGLHQFAHVAELFKQLIHLLNGRSASLRNPVLFGYH